MRPRGRRRPRAGPCAWLLAALLLACALPPPLHAQEEGLFELHVPGLPATATLGVILDGDGQPLVPLGVTARHAGIPMETRGDTLFLEWPPGTWASRVELATRRVAAGDSAWTVPEDEWVRRAGEAYLSPAALGRVLAATVQVDWENLTLRLAGRDDFPAPRLLRLEGEREAARRAYGGLSPRRRAEPEVPYLSRTGGVAVGWGLSGTATDQFHSFSARAAAGVSLLGGSLEGGLTATGSSSRAGDLSDPFVRYVRAFPGSGGVRQLRLGDVLSDGLVTRPLFGVALSNEPLYTPDYFGDVLIRPVVPAGWEVEVYQGNYLVGVSGRGAAPVATPLGYGSTPVRIRMISPAGEERVQQLVFLVPANQVPAGEWRWYLGAGRCRYAQCDGFGYADLRRGLSPRLTVGAGVEVLDSAGRGAEARPYGVLHFNPRPDLRTELRAQPGSLMRLAMQRQRPDGGGWSASGGWNAAGADSLSRPGWYAQGHLATPLPLLGSARMMSLQGSVRGHEGAVEAWQGTLSSRIPRGQVALTYESGFQPRDVLGVEALAFVSPRALHRLRDLTVSSRVDLSGDGLYAWTVGTSFRPVRSTGVYANVAWYPDRGGPTVSLSLVTRTPAAYVQTSAHSDPGYRSASLAAGGGAAVGGGGFLTLPTETIGRGGVTGRVYVDRDGDGAWSPGEPAAAGVPVVVGGERAVTGADGRYALWGVRPYAALPVGVDTLGMTATDLAPRAAPALVRPAPNMYTRVDVALVPTRELVGRLRWRGESGPLGGITVEARRAGEEEPRTALSFSDGEFYLSRLPAGEYTLTVRESALRALGAVSLPDTLRFSVPVQGDQPYVDVGTLLLRRASDSVPAAPAAADTGAADGLAERLPRRIFFDSDRAALRAASAATLDSVAELLRADTTLRVVMDGHTDAAGDAAYNQRLGWRRATAAAARLEAGGVARERMRLRSFGEGTPAGDNRTRGGRQLNRRVEIAAEERRTEGDRTATPGR